MSIMTSYTGLRDVPDWVDDLQGNVDVMHFKNVSSITSNAIFYGNLSTISSSSLADGANLVHTGWNVSSLANDAEYVSNALLSTSLLDVVYGDELTSALSNVVYQSNLNSALANVVFQSNLNSALSNIVYLSNLDSALANVVYQSNLNSALSNVVYLSNLDSALANVVYQSNLNSALANVVYQSNLNSALSNIVYQSNLDSALTNVVYQSNLASVLANVVYYSNLSNISVFTLANTNNLVQQGSNVSFNSITATTGNIGTLVSMDGNIRVVVTETLVSNTIVASDLNASNLTSVFGDVFDLQSNVIQTDQLYVTGDTIHLGNSTIKVTESGGMDAWSIGNMVVDGLGIAWDLGEGSLQLFNSLGELTSPLDPGLVEDLAANVAEEISSSNTATRIDYVNGLRRAPVGETGIGQHTALYNTLHMQSSIVYDSTNISLDTNDNCTLAATSYDKVVLDIVNQKGYLNTLYAGSVQSSNIFSNAGLLVMGSDLQVKGNLVANNAVVGNLKANGAVSAATMSVAGNITGAVLNVGAIQANLDCIFAKDVRVGNITGNIGLFSNTLTSHGDFRCNAKGVVVNNFSVFGNHYANSLSVAYDTQMTGNLSANIGAFNNSLSVHGDFRCNSRAVVVNNFSVFGNHYANSLSVAYDTQMSGNLSVARELVVPNGNVHIPNGFILVDRIECNEGELLINANIKIIGDHYLIIDPADLTVEGSANIWYELRANSISVSNTSYLSNVIVSKDITVASKIISSAGAASPPSLGVLGGTGDRIILYAGGATYYPYSIGIDGGTLWFNTPAGSVQKMGVGGTTVLTVASSLVSITTPLSLTNASSFTGKTSELNNDAGFLTSSSNLNASKISSGTINNSYLPSTISVSSFQSGSFPAPTSQGNFIGWNRSGSSGTATFANQLGGGIGGWEWVAYNNSNVLTGVVMSLSQAGVLTANSINLPFSTGFTGKTSQLNNDAGFLTAVGTGYVGNNTGYNLSCGTINSGVVSPSSLNLTFASAFTGKTSQLNNDAGFLTSVSSSSIAGINSTGSVGINQSSPSYTLDVNGTGKFSGLLNCYGGIYFQGGKVYCADVPAVAVRSTDGYGVYADGCFGIEFSQPSAGVYAPTFITRNSDGQFIWKKVASASDNGTTLMTLNNCWIFGIKYNDPRNPLDIRWNNHPAWRFNMPLK